MQNNIGLVSKKKASIQHKQNNSDAMKQLLTDFAGDSKPDSQQPVSNKKQQEGQDLAQNQKSMKKFSSLSPKTSAVCVQGKKESTDKKQQVFPPFRSFGILNQQNQTIAGWKNTQQEEPLEGQSRPQYQGLRKQTEMYMQQSNQIMQHQYPVASKKSNSIHIAKQIDTQQSNLNQANITNIEPNQNHGSVQRKNFQKNIHDPIQRIKSLNNKGKRSADVVEHRSKKVHQQRIKQIQEDNRKISLNKQEGNQDTQFESSEKQREESPFVVRPSLQGERQKDIKMQRKKFKYAKGTLDSFKNNAANFLPNKTKSLLYQHNPQLLNQGESLQSHFIASGQYKEESDLNFEIQSIKDQQLQANNRFTRCPLIIQKHQISPKVARIQHQNIAQQQQGNPFKSSNTFSQFSGASQPENGMISQKSNSIKQHNKNFSQVFEYVPSLLTQNQPKNQPSIERLINSDKSKFLGLQEEIKSKQILYTTQDNFGRSKNEREQLPSPFKPYQIPVKVDRTSVRFYNQQNLTKSYMINHEGGVVDPKHDMARGTAVEQGCDDKVKGPYSHKINSDKHKQLITMYPLRPLPLSTQQIQPGYSNTLLVQSEQVSSQEDSRQVMGSVIESKMQNKTPLKYVQSIITQTQIQLQQEHLSSSNDAESSQQQNQVYATNPLNSVKSTNSKAMQISQQVQVQQQKTQPIKIRTKQQIVKNGLIKNPLQLKKNNFQIQSIKVMNPDPTTTTSVVQEQKTKLVLNKDRVTLQQQPQIISSPEQDASKQNVQQQQMSGKNVDNFSNYMNTTMNRDLKFDFHNDNLNLGSGQQADNLSDNQSSQMQESPSKKEAENYLNKNLDKFLIINKLQPNKARLDRTPEKDFRIGPRKRTPTKKLVLSAQTSETNLMQRIDISEQLDQDKQNKLSSRCSSEQSHKKDSYAVMKKPTIIDIENLDESKGSPLRIVNQNLQSQKQLSKENDSKISHKTKSQEEQANDRAQENQESFLRSPEKVDLNSLNLAMTQHLQNKDESVDIKAINKFNSYKSKRDDTISLGHTTDLKNNQKIIYEIPLDLVEDENYSENYPNDHYSYSKEESEENKKNEDQILAESKCHINTNVIIGDLLGTGSYGQVFKGLNQSDHTFLAVKVMKVPEQIAEDKQVSLMDELEKEIHLLKYLRHQNIVNYYDSCKGQNQEVKIFMEYMPQGSLQSLISMFGGISSDNILRNYARQLVSGLEYLHSKNVIHADLKCANILHDGQGNIKLSDFGAAKYMDELVPQLDSSYSGVGFAWSQGSLFWMAPEILNGKPYGRRSDIWSLACTLIELASGQHPWPHVTEPYQIVKELVEGKTPQIPPHISADAKDFLQKCLQIEKKNRPSIKELLSHPFIKLNKE